MRLLISALCALAIVPAAGGFTVAGDRWPGPTVRVFDETGYKTPVNDAKGLRMIYGRRAPA